MVSPESPAGSVWEPTPTSKFTSIDLIFIDMFTSVLRARHAIAPTNTPTPPPPHPDCGAGWDYGDTMGKPVQLIQRWCPRNPTGRADAEVRPYIAISPVHNHCRVHVRPCGHAAACPYIWIHPLV